MRRREAPAPHANKALRFLHGRRLQVELKFVQKVIIRTLCAIAATFADWAWRNRRYGRHNEPTLVTTGLDPVVHAEDKLSMDCRIKSGNDEQQAVRIDRKRNPGAAVPPAD